MIASPTAVKQDPQGFGNHPVGTGPFVFKEWVKGDHITLTRNPDYWNKPLPYADQVTFRPIPNDDSREATLISGGININENPGPKSMVDAEKDANLRVIRSAGLGSNFVMFNTRRPPTDDVRVRRALALATDRKLILKAIFFNLYDPIEGPFARGTWAHVEHVPGFATYDLEQAKAEAKAYGKPIELTLTVQNTPLTIRVGEALQAMWGKIGVKTTLKPVEQHLGIENALTKEFQAEIFRWAGRPDPDGSVYKFFNSKYATVRSSNYTQYANPEMDRLLDAGVHELDRGKRKQIYADIAALLAKDVPYDYLFASAFFNITAKKVHGIVPVPDGLARVRNVWLD
jgi:peptide/nickel transport system substrate-binding protein